MHLRLPESISLSVVAVIMASEKKKKERNKESYVDLTVGVMLRVVLKFSSKSVDSCCEL